MPKESGVAPMEHLAAHALEQFDVADWQHLRWLFSYRRLFGPTVLIVQGPSETIACLPAGQAPVDLGAYWDRWARAAVSLAGPPQHAYSAWALARQRRRERLRGVFWIGLAIFHAFLGLRALRTPVTAHNHGPMVASILAVTLFVVSAGMFLGACRHLRGRPRAVSLTVEPAHLLVRYADNRVRVCDLDARCRIDLHRQRNARIRCADGCTIGYLERFSHWPLLRAKLLNAIPADAASGT